MTTRRRSAGERITIKSMPYYVYLMASGKNGTLYVGVTNDLVRRVYEHRTNVVDGFTRQYDVHHLVWFEATDDITTAIRREKQLKNWKRDWKIALIEQTNPECLDLYDSLL